VSKSLTNHEEINQQTVNKLYMQQNLSRW